MSQAFAQQPTDTAHLAPTVVTVTRAPSTMNATAAALSAVRLTESARHSTGIALDDALRAVPGVQVDNSFNWALGERISIRGFGGRAQFGVRGVRVIVDGVPATMPDGQTTLNHVETSDLERAEVIRGPAASLYGNAAGGVIQLEGRTAPAQPFAPQLRMLSGDDGLRRAEGGAGGTVERFDYSALATRSAWGGSRGWNDASSDRVTARAGWNAGAAGTLRLSLAGVDYAANNPGGLSDSAMHVDPTQAFANNVKQHAGESGRHRQAGLRWGLSRGVTDVEVAGYTLTRALDNPIPVRIIALDRDASGGRALLSTQVLGARLTAGAEVQGLHDDRKNWANNSGARGAISLDQLERVNSTGVFGQLVRPFGRLGLSAGVRGDAIRFGVSDRLVTATNPDDSGERTLHAVSPSAGATFALTRSMAVYANVATAFETPTTTELANRPTEAGGFNPDLQPQRTRSGELGIRATTVTTHVIAQWSATLYRAHIRDALVPFEVPSAPGRQFFRNAATATHQGAELGAQLALGAAATLDAAYTITDAKFDRYSTATATYDGNRVPGVAPRHLDATLGLTRGWLFAQLAVRAQSSMAVDDANQDHVAGYAVWDLRSSARSRAFGGVALSPMVGISNLFDATYVSSVVINATGRRYYEPAPKRLLYAGVSLGAR
ncbi:MAG: TonB-dependent receptor [Gemmatimonadetes bacterium]|nr:TonB-dependent receptor [Gemmatimonadota bacterium]